MVAFGALPLLKIESAKPLTAVESVLPTVGVMLWIRVAAKESKFIIPYLSVGKDNLNCDCNLETILSVVCKSNCC